MTGDALLFNSRAGSEARAQCVLPVQQRVGTRLREHFRGRDAFDLVVVKVPPNAPTIQDVRRVVTSLHAAAVMAQHSAKVIVGTCPGRTVAHCGQ